MQIENCQLQIANCRKRQTLPIADLQNLPVQTRVNQTTDKRGAFHVIGN
jgi:hypothetical protein